MSRPTKAKNIETQVRLAVDSGRLLYSGHSIQRMKERGIIKPEVEFILTNGHHESRKDQFNEEHNSWDYAFKGKTVDDRQLRIVVAFVEPSFLIVTVIDLNK